MNHTIKAAKLPAGLYLVATPIGNLRDITLRALDVLSSVDSVICEDTRVTGKLLSAYSIKQKMIVFNDHSESRERGPVIGMLTSGGAVALVSDAGTPLISDPGYKLVRDCLDLGIAVTVVPGANAALSGLQLSGLPSDKFSFLGFLPPKSVARKKQMTPWRNSAAPLIFYETGPRLAESLRDMADVFGDRPAAVVREITKMFEESRRGTLSHLAAHYEEHGAPKGEIVVVVNGAAEEEATAEDIETMIGKALETMSVKDAAAFVAEQTGQPKKAIYEKALSFNKKKD